jgi:cell division protein FtsB
MKVFAVALVLVLAILQYRLWVSDEGMRSVVALRAGVKAQTAENHSLQQRNDQLVAEVKDLKEGLAALEERARTDLGMIGSNETFFQVVEAGHMPPPAAATPAPAPPPASAPAAEALPIQRTSR